MESVLNTKCSLLNKNIKNKEYYDILKSIERIKNIE